MPGPRRAGRKGTTVPDIYPLSLNALTSGCNQKNNRDPVLKATEAEVQAAVDRLSPLSFVIESSGSRVMRYSQNVARVLSVPSESVALLATLWLRGPQTAAELRAASERLHRFADVSSVEGYLEQLGTRAADAGGAAGRPASARPGMREQRWAHLLSAAPRQHRSRRRLGRRRGRRRLPALRDELRAEIARLREELQELRARVERLEGRAGSDRADRAGPCAGNVCTARNFWADIFCEVSAPVSRSYISPAQRSSRCVESRLVHHCGIRLRVHGTFGFGSGSRCLAAVIAARACGGRHEQVQTRRAIAWPRSSGDL